MAQKRSVPVRNRNRHIPCSALDLSERLLWELDTDVSRRVAVALATDHNDIFVDVDPRAYTCVDTFWRDWLAVNLVKKFPGLSLNSDPSETARKAFFDAEASCKLINETLASLIVTPSIGVTVASYIHTARRNISELLGDFDWAAAEEYFAFSGGASTRLPRRRGAPFYKYSGIPEVTPDALHLAIAAVKRIPCWAREMVAVHGEDARKWFKLTCGSRITTVPKTAKTHRTIAIEPCMNMFLQKGIGGMMRRRLKKVSVDLDDQTKNQVLARQGSLDGRLATIDLSAASDSVSLELVRLLLPPDWFDAIELTRSSFGRFSDGNVIRFEKVSSMGNGFTFELESLIFWALSKAVLQLNDISDRRLAVYGDDIVISVDAVPQLVELLAATGFKTNVEKSFYDGPFRESCGKHYFHGIDVTPIYVKAPIDCDVRLLWFANSIRRWAARPTFPYCDSRFRTTYDRTVSLISNGNRKVIPEGIGDGGLVGTFDECRPAYHRRRQVFSVEVLAEVFQKWRPDGTPALLTWFQDNPVGSQAGVGRKPLALAKVTGRYTKSKVFLSQWAESPFW